MATPFHHPPPASVVDTIPIVIKISTGSGDVKKIRLPLKDLRAEVLPGKLRQLLKIKQKDVIFERFSDSLGSYVKLDPENRDVFKSLQRAAKAKLKLRLKATTSSTASPDTDISSSTAVIKRSKVQQPILEQSSARCQKVVPDQAMAGPIIAHSPHDSAGHRETTALAPHSIGPGIFAFKADRQAPVATAGDKTAVPTAEPAFDLGLCSKPFNVATAAKPRESSQLPATTPTNPNDPWIICCNECDEILPDTHYHCSICNAGDFDLCQACVTMGKLCPGQDHWLIRRTISNGQAQSSTTERLAPKQSAPQQSSSNVKPDIEVKSTAPSASSSHTEQSYEHVLTRTCNCCIESSSEENFVNCKDCEDYDLCLKCHMAGKHGHHPAHTFQPAVDGVKITSCQKLLLGPDRYNVHEAVCDACDKTICGVRHKCFDCPDYDLCSKCITGADVAHPGHRFGAMYKPIKTINSSRVCHRGILCDGNACTLQRNQKPIEGVRYKCVVCDDVDLCADCEALPIAEHDKTHPLLKITSPLRGVNICTMQDDSRGGLHQLGEKQAEPKALLSSENATSSIKTVADFEPTLTTPATTSTGSTQPLNAHFIRDAVLDGTKAKASTCMTQIWTLRNPGPSTWPVGCSVQFVGGDNMLDVGSNKAPMSSAMATAIETNAVGREVLPGEQFDFKIGIRAPLRAGRAISYWRLKAPNGTAFGHRLWCEINVEAADSEEADRTAAKPFATNVTEQPSTFAIYEEQLEALRMRNVQRLARVKMSDQSLKSYYTKYQERMQQLHAAQTSGQGECRQSRIARLPIAISNLESQVKRDAENKVVPSTTPLSKMVFPKLERESPASSTAELNGKGTAAVVTASVLVPRSPCGSGPSTPVEGEEEAFDDLGDELEVMSAEEESDGDNEGFLTDEEYDILDASDQETIASSK